MFSVDAATTDGTNWDDLIAPILVAAKILVKRLKPEVVLERFITVDLAFSNMVTFIASTVSSH